MSARAFRMPFFFRGATRIPPFRFFRFGARRRRAAFAGLFAPRKPRHPLMKLAIGLTGLALLALLLVFGLVVGAAMIGAGIALRLWRGRNRAQTTAQQRTVEAEYRVLRKPQLPNAPIAGGR